MTSKVLGVKVDIITRFEALEKVEFWLLKKTLRKMVVTAYSEFFVKASRDINFARVVNGADLVVADGVSVLAAVEYKKRSRGKSVLGKIFAGLGVGGEILKGTLGETVTGVWLFESLTEEAKKRNWKVFVLGGWNGVAARSAEKLSLRGVKVEFDEGEKKVGTSSRENKRIIDKINRFKPDLLFVAYNPVTQEKWIEENKKDLVFGVAMGIGGTLNEFVGDLKLAPVWMQRMGLKWLWRLILEPSRWKRIVDAVIVFPLLVFKDSLEAKS